VGVPLGGGASYGLEMSEFDHTVFSYTRDYEAKMLEAKQKREYSRVMDELLARHDAGELLTDEQYSALTTHFVG
jgi:hypothetical protein